MNRRRLRKVLNQQNPKLSEYQKDSILYALEYPDWVLSKKTGDRVHKKEDYRPQNLLAPGLFQRGYGGVEYWPFSVKMAVTQTGYRRGILRAINNPAYNKQWRQEADLLLDKVYEIQSGKRELFEVLHFSK